MTLKDFSRALFLFYLVKKIIENLFSFSSELVLILDITQWKNTNILMISLAWKKRAIRLYWKILTHKGAKNLTEQKAVIRPVIRLLKPTFRTSFCSTKRYMNDHQNMSQQIK